MADSMADKARKARERAADNNYKPGKSSSKTDRLVMDLTRGTEKGIKKALTSEGLGRYPNAEERRAAAIMQQRRKIDTGKVAARATAMEKRAAAEKKAKTLTTGVSGGTKAKAKPTTKKVAAKATTKKMGKK
jgi:prolyl-tRNA editing enzyme YbaK/EbsC (Cys-tRNA(Pro) deacylase)